MDASSEFTKFSQEGLDRYAKWLKDERKMRDVKLEDPPVREDYTKILSGNIDAIAVHKKEQWPVMCRQVYQHPKAKTKSVHEIAQSREKFYLAFDNDTDKWVVKKGTPVYFACQNILKLTGFKFMHLVVYNPRNEDILVVEVHYDESYKEAFSNLSDDLFGVSKSKKGR